MQITIAAYGSRGDVQPLVALGVRLKAAGHDVRVVSDAAFRSLVEDYGLAFFAMAGDIRTYLTQENRGVFDNGSNPLRLVRAIGRLSRDLGPVWAHDLQRMSDAADLLIAGGAGVWMGMALAEQRHIPLVGAALQPFAPTSDFASPLVPPHLPLLPRQANRLTHRLIDQLLWLALRPVINSLRASMGVRRWSMRSPTLTLERKGVPTIHGYSPTVVPPPSDWPSSVHVTGYWFLDPPPNWTPPADLERFLERGPAPVYMGFGSMADRNPEATSKLLVAAAQRLGCRALISSGWAGLKAEQLPETVKLVEAVPHEWLFPRVSAVVHHGGAGTTAAAARAGVPAVVVPFTADQPFWADRVWQLGAAPPPIARPHLQLERLTTALDHALSDQTMRTAAAALGAQIRQEDGVGAAVQVIERASSWRWH